MSRRPFVAAVLVGAFGLAALLLAALRAMERRDMEAWVWWVWEEEYD